MAATLNADERAMLSVLGSTFDTLREWQNRTENAGTEPDGLMFTFSGKPITRSVFGHKWRSAVDTAGLPVGTGFHGLRH